MSEVWKDITGYEGLYQVSDLGRVRSLDKTVNNSRGYYFKEGKNLKTIKGNDNRQYVNLSVRGIVKRYSIHSLVALAFIGERPEGYHVCHLNGDSLDNRLSNIRYDIASQNEIDKYRYGKKSGRGKLSIEQVLEIRKLYSTNEYTQQKLADIYKVARSTIGYVLREDTFKWLNDDGSIDESDTAVS